MTQEQAFSSLAKGLVLALGEVEGQFKVCHAYQVVETPQPQLPNAQLGSLDPSW